MDMDRLSQFVSIAIVLDSEICALLFRKTGLNVNSEYKIMFLLHEISNCKSLPGRFRTDS